ncbi:uncharacterized protein Z519_10099 [Cladophialophora bantiana CBS 173.52]|uniref:Uncharacterized protein n=1 Tax=Cladophialophora bantiana (strain ATCC 10958 / CBS 173.52 / CDC B-1940 / NIH 8579) TaxID=1442370 RepID=A0A0D2EGR0_CLAB1|nr:uncharacterized protein Z519_10099 [Cladophialophora bantiana CBS 173.52]KIW89246.1 hypothetical protein Z519_10099 [Cladophialophora bantiana CBS 173.52]
MAPMSSGTFCKNTGAPSLGWRRAKGVPFLTPTLYTAQLASVASSTPANFPYPVDVDTQH